MAEDIPGDARLLTYAELGELLGIEPESAKRRAVRHGWRRVPGNEGRTLVAVPRTALPERPSIPKTTAARSGDRAGDRDRDVAQDNAGDIQRDNSGRPGDRERATPETLADLRIALRAAEQRQSEADERAGRAEARADAAQALADRRGEELGELRERVGRAEGEAAALRERERVEQERTAARARDAEAAQEAVRAELATWTSGGPFVRAVRAFLNRRGRV